MADEQPETGKDVIAQKVIEIMLKMNSKDLKALDPVMEALRKKLNEVAKASDIKHGMFGKDFFSAKVKEFTGLNNSLFKSIKNLGEFGRLSKLTGVDNKEFYNSLNLLGKGLASTIGFFSRKAAAAKKAREEDIRSKNVMADLDEQMSHGKGMAKALDESDHLSINLKNMGLEAGDAGGMMNSVLTPSIEAATEGAQGFWAAASLGLTVIVTLAITAGKLFYRMFSQALTARTEFKKFDEMFGGVGSPGIAAGIKQLQSLNRELWGLGFSIEKVNGVVLAAVQGGLNFSRAIDSRLVGSILELSGASGAAAGEIGNLYVELLKTTKIGMGSIQELGNSFIAFNRSAHSSATLGQVSFSMFKESIMSSANALAIAANKGDDFTNRMTKDLTALAGLASTLSLSISEMNRSFEEAGSMLSSPDSGFRTLLSLSGGANINQMLSNQFDKTDAMLKGVKYLQEFNKSFGGNIQLTAQVAEKQLGISRDMAIKMINMRKETIADMMKAQSDIAGLQTNATRDAFEKVNSDLASVWGRIKTMFSTFFQNAFGGSGGMQRLVSKIEHLLATVKDYMTNAGWIDKLQKIIDKVSDWLGNKLGDIVEWIGDKLDKFADPDSENPIVSLWDTCIEKLKDAAGNIGLQIVWGMVKGVSRFSAALLTLGWSEVALQSANNSSEKSILSQTANPLKGQLSYNKKREAELLAEQQNNSKYAPDRITYGKDAFGNVGFMTIAQKQYALEVEKKKLEDEDRNVQRQIRDAVKAMAERKSEDYRASMANTSAKPTPYSPFGVPPSLNDSVAAASAL